MGHCGVGYREEGPWSLHAGDAYFDSKVNFPDPAPGLPIEIAFQTNAADRQASIRKLQVLRAELDDEESILSLTAPGVEGWEGEARIGITRRVNDYGADLVEQRPERFGYFSTLALPDVDAALAEVQRSFDVLHADGVTLHSNYDGIYLSDARFDPVWQELERRSAFVDSHPTRPPQMPVLPGAPSPFADYPADTTRCALDLVRRGHPKRFASTKVMLSHGGGPAGRFQRRGLEH